MDLALGNLKRYHLNLQQLLLIQQIYGRVSTLPVVFLFMFEVYKYVCLFV